MTPKWLRKTRKDGPDITKPVPIGPLATPLPGKKQESPAWKELMKKRLTHSNIYRERST